VGRRTLFWLGVTAGLVVLGLAAGWVLNGPGDVHPTKGDQVALGQTIYAENCASCHGDRLQGQPNWRERKPDGRLPAPPHDASGHTWHHPDDVLFGIVKEGLAKYAPPGYESDMPAFGGRLSDDQIQAVLAYIKDTWPKDIQTRQAAISKQSPQK
jgi:mono/diheme cytochrome c family protein